MKRIIAVLLTIAIMLSLVGCGDKTASNADLSMPESDNNILSSEVTSEDNSSLADITSNDASISVESSKPAESSKPITSSKPTESSKPTNSSKLSSSSAKPSSSQSPSSSTPSTATHTHSFSAATCTAPKKCSCGATEGKALGHKWKEATCTEPKTCTRCDESDGFSRLGHVWSKTSNGTYFPCSRCGETYCKAEHFGHCYVGGNCVTPTMCFICGDTILDDNAKNNHSYCNGKCILCDNFEEESTNLAKKVINSIITQDMSEFEKAFQIHDYIIDNTEYDYDFGRFCYEPLGALKYGKAVCSGYTLTFELLCETAGLECEWVGGSAGGGSHAWNQVKIDNKWYNVDVTWDDGANQKLYKYFLISDEEMYSNHKPNDQYLEQIHICNESYNLNLDFFINHFGLVKTIDDLPAYIENKINNNIFNFSFVHEVEELYYPYRKYIKETIENIITSTYGYKQVKVTHGFKTDKDNKKFIFFFIKIEK